jgi:opacity protein-like surface antigen
MCAFAQRAPEEGLKRFEVSGGIGWSELTDGQGTLGPGTNYSGGVGFFILPRLSVGFEMNRTVHSGFLPMTDQFRRSDGLARFTLVDASYYFLRKGLLGIPLAPYVTAGGGKVKVRRRDRYLQAVALPGGASNHPNVVEQLLHEDDINTQEAALAAGIGVDIGLSPHFFLRPEFRFFDASSQTMRRGAMALAFRW